MSDRMKTVIINGVPYRMRGDMPFYEEMIQKDLADEKYEESTAGSRQDYKAGYDEGYEDGYDNGYDRGQEA